MWKRAVTQLLLIVLVVGIAAAQQPAGKEISEEEAVRAAEQFVKDNGYTDEPVKDPKNFAPELLDKLVTPETVLKVRRNSLEKKAYGVAKRKRGGLPGWSVIFKRISCDYCDPKKGRAVVMDLDGSKIKMDHIDFSLDAVDKKFGEEKKD